MMKNKILQRQRVNEALDCILGYPLTIVTATIGYGKTTAVKEWAKDKHITTIWLPLCEDDILEDIVWNRFVLAWEKSFAKQHSLRRLNGFPRDIYQVSEFVDILTQAAAGRPVVLICDDYQFVDENPKIRKITEQIAQEEIQNFHIVLISRYLTQLNSALLSAKGLCRAIGTDTLAFTNAEIDEYFELNGLHIDPLLLSKIKNFAEGWTAALVLTQMNAKQNAVVPILDMDHLMSESFNSLFDEPSRIMLAKLSFLEKFTMSEAIYILETRAIINVLELGLERNAFVYFDAKTEYYRMHALTRSFLQKFVKNAGIDITREKYRTGVWLWEHGDISESMTYYLDMGNANELIALLSKCDLVYLYHLNPELFYRLCTSLPLETSLEYPIPYLYMYLHLSFSGNQHMAALASKIFIFMDNYFQNTDLDIDPEILGELEAVKAGVYFSDIYKVVEHVKKARKLLGEHGSKLIAKADTTTFGIPMYTYIYFKDAGGLQKLISFFLADFIAIIQEKHDMQGIDQLVLAEYALETGDLPQAHTLAQKTVFIVTNHKFTSIAICAVHTLVRYYLASGKPAEAMKKIIETRQVLLSHRPQMSAESNASYNTMVDLSEAYANACLGLLDPIPSWIKSGDLSGGSFRVNGLGFINIIRSKCLLLEEKWLELEALTISFEKGYLEFHNQFGLLHNRIYLAIAKYKLYGMQAGVVELLQVLNEAAMDNIVLMFTENAKYLLPMLHYININHMMQSEYFDKVLRTSLDYENMLSGLRPNKPTPPSITFTDRELEVIDLLLNGLMGQEIANQLCLSLIAVKKHLGNIYRKLGVTHKGAAIKRLNDMRLI